MRRRLFLLALFAAVTVSAEAQTVTVAWDPSPSTDVAGYRVYRDGSRYADVTGLQAVIPVVYDVQHTVWVTAYNANGVEGVASNTVTTMTPTPVAPELCAPDGTGNGIDEDLDGQYDETCMPAPTSINGTEIPRDGWRLVDDTSAVWTIRNREILRDYVSASGGIGDLLLWWNTRVYAKNATQPDANGSWWVWGGSWSQVASDPRIALPPPPESCGADGYGNGIDDDGDGQIDEGCAVRPPADTIAPTVSLSVTRNGKSANYTATATAKDNVGIVSVQIFVNGQGLPSCTSSPCSVTVKVGKGVYSFVALASDAAGNVGQSPTRTVSN